MSIVPSIFKGEISGKWKEGDDMLGCRHELGKDHRDVSFAFGASRIISCHGQCKIQSRGIIQGTP